MQTVCTGVEVSYGHFGTSAETLQHECRNTLAPLLNSPDNLDLSRV